MEITTICYIEKEDKYLMLHKFDKEGYINSGKWLGIGGHFENFESPEECIIREVKEESGLTLLDYRLRGVITFVSDGAFLEYIFLFTADKFEGEICECDEGTLEWVKKSDVYQLNMWEGDRVFLRLLEEREDFFSLKLEYEKDKVISCQVDGKKLENLSKMLKK